MNDKIKTIESINLTTVLAEHSFFKGDLEVQGSLSILGDVHGNIKAKERVILGPLARVKGSINATEILVYGSCQGDLSASYKIKIFNSGFVFGNINSREIAIEKDAIIAGNFLINTHSSHNSLGSSVKKDFFVLNLESKD